MKLPNHTPLTGSSFILLFMFFWNFSLQAQQVVHSGIVVKVEPDSKAVVWFNGPLHAWDGFGVNYVEACQTRDYKAFPQDYSGFSFATDETRKQVLELIFGVDGLRPALTKLFLDPFHEGLTKRSNDNSDPFVLNMSGYDHESTTRWMRYFNTEGQNMMKQWGGSLTAIATLYGPAPWMTKQKYVLGRDVDPAEKFEIAEYMASWAKFLIEKEKINVKFFSLHNEGDAYYRWPRDGSNPGEDHRDYNMYWPAEQVVDFLKVSRNVFDRHGLKSVLLTPGETQTWYRFDKWGYASAIVNEPEALKSLGLITSHSFTVIDQPNSIFYGDFRSVGQDLIREKKPEIHTWVTSRPWGKGPQFIDNISRDIYECKANGLIPWALVSGAGQWLTSKGFTDGSMEVAFLINRDGSLEILDGYYYYKQVSRAGQPGMHVAQVECYDPAITVLAFSGKSSKHRDAFVLVNKSDIIKNVNITLKGTDKLRWTAFRTSDTEKYLALPTLEGANGMLEYSCPANSVTTFFGE